MEKAGAAVGNQSGGRRGGEFRQLARLLGIAVVILVLVAVFSRVQPGFLSFNNLALIFKYYSPVAVLALGMTLVILTGGIDLSVGFLMVFLMFVMASLGVRAGIAPGAAILAGLGVAAGIGAAVGACVAYARIPPFIITLAVMVAAHGGTQLLSGNQAITGLPPALEWLGGTQMGDGNLRLPVMALVVIALYGAAALVLKRTRYGRYLYAVGSNREAARLNGIPVGLVELSAYVGMAVCCWLAALMQLGVNHTADPKVASSDSLELNAIAMVVIGGTSLTGGRGTVLGTALGVALLSILFNGLPMLGGMFGDTSWRKLVQAAVILLGAVLDAVQRRYWKE